MVLAFLEHVWPKKNMYLKDVKNKTLCLKQVIKVPSRVVSVCGREGDGEDLLKEMEARHTLELELLFYE